MKRVKTICFLSKYATWQDYRNEVLTCLGQRYHASVEMLTTGELQPYLQDNQIVKYKIFRSWLPLSLEKYGFFPGAVWHIIKTKPYAVLCQNDTRQFTEYLAFFICKLCRIRFVWWTHAHMPSVVYHLKIRKWIRQKYALFFLKRAAAVITYCQIGRQYLLEQGVDAQRVYCAPNTLDTDTLLQQADSLRQNFTKEQLREKLNLPESDHYLLYMGRLTARKKIESAIQLVGKLASRDTGKCHLVIIGDGAFRENLESLAKDIAPGSVTFAGAIFEGAQKALYFSLADLFVIPGAVGLAIIYAFAFRLPVLTTNVANHGPEIIYLKHGKNGFICSDGDIDELANAAVRLIDDVSLYQKMADTAEQTIVQNANIQLMVSRMASALNL